MKSLRNLYRIGKGPSSSHTMGPEAAALRFKSFYGTADFYEATLYGSLALTGKGHLTDEAVRNAFFPKTSAIIFDTETGDLPHPNTMDLRAYSNGALLGEWRVCSVGGGAIQVMGMPETDEPDVYPHKNFSEISAYCREHSLSLWEYVEQYEGKRIWEDLGAVWDAMKQAVKEGLAAEGVLPGGLELLRKAKHLYETRLPNENPETRESRLVCAYAFAVSEQNAGGGRIVTAPTCGACGILPAVLAHRQQKFAYSDEEILHALAAAGIIGNCIKTNASISGAEAGCQAEVGSACSMASAALAQLMDLSLEQIEYAAEVALEHHLGLTCDPVCGLVQIPCIERNAVAAMRAINSVNIAQFLTYARKISFDMVVETMYQTGKDLHKIYRETAEGGLAKIYK